MSPFGHVLSDYMVSTRCEGHGVEYHPNVTENGHTEQGNPSGALSELALNEVKGLWSRRPGRKP
jgi:hypothetical protein